ncbi:hypothetical protein LX36DRAFT_82624 [Colletotrichum falcatum]|nr:hypothetical protein LX36DRAFT_82624 [Colletotrichum falcatum]
MRRHILAQGAVVLAAFLGSVCAQLDSLSPCGVACVNNVIAKGFGCASGDNTCLCKQQDFVFGVRDCAAQSCTADESTKANDYVAGLCATATRAPPASTPPASDPPPSIPAAQQTTPPVAPSSTSRPTPPPANIAVPTQASASETLISAASSSSSPAEATSKPITEATILPTTTVTTLATSVKPQASSTTSTSTGAQQSQSASAPDAGAENQSSEAVGLSTPAKIGIGVGAGAGIFAIALALWLLIRRPKTQFRAMQISGPMPGSGRDYTGGIIGMKDRNHSELDARSKRYEDMVPRQSPRRLI